MWSVTLREENRLKKWFSVLYSRFFNVGFCIVIYSWGTHVNSLILLGLHFYDVCFIMLV
jgi:hypothetical protein